MEGATFFFVLVLHVLVPTSGLGGRAEAVADPEADACLKFCVVTHMRVIVPSRRKRDVRHDSQLAQNLEPPPAKYDENTNLDSVLSALTAGTWNQVPHKLSKLDKTLDHPGQLHNVSPSHSDWVRETSAATETDPSKENFPSAREVPKRYVRDSPLYGGQRYVMCRLPSNASLRIGACLHSMIFNASDVFFPLSVVCPETSRDHTQVYVDNALPFSKAHIFAVNRCSVNISKTFAFTDDVVLRGLLMWDSTVDGFEHFISNAPFSKTGTIQVVNSSFPTSDLSLVLTFLGHAKNVVWRNNTVKIDDCEESFLQNISTENLTFSFTNLTFVPPCIFGENLTFLSLSNNRISDLSNLQYPAKVPSQHLSYLKLDHNEIRDLGVIAFFDFLCELSVSHNRMSRVSTSSVSQLLWITKLDLSYNQITHVASGAFRLNKILTCLDLSHNWISVIDSSHTGISRMNFVLDFNRLSQPPFAADNFSSPLVGRVWAAHNPYYCDCSLESFQLFLQGSHDISGSVPERQCSNADPCYSNDDPAQMFFMQVPQYKCTKAGSGEELVMMSLDFRKTCPVFDGCPAPCDCFFTAADGRTVVDCSNSNLTDFPVTLPQGRIDLRLHGNDLREFREAGFLTRVERLDLSRAGLSRLSPVVCDFLNKTKSVNLSDIGLSELPECMQGLDLAGRTLDLSANPWRCDCRSVWMARWIAANPDVFAEQGNVRCANAPFQGVAVRDVDVSRLSCDPPNYLGLSVGLVVLGVALGSVVAILYRSRGVWMPLLYDTFGVRLFQWRRHEQQPEGEAKEFDVFVSYSSKDEHWVLRQLAPNLEGKGTRQPLKLCLHFRHFAVGEAIADNILCAVDRSRATLLVLSPAFLASEWCLFEFQQAHYQLLTEGATSLVVVILDDLDPAMLTPELAAFLKNHACLDVRKRWFWQKLRYALPRPRKRTDPGGDDVRVQNWTNEEPDAIDLGQVTV